MNKTTIVQKYYKAEIKVITERTGKNGPYLMWEFESSTGERIVGFTDADLVVGNRTWTWLTMLGIPVWGGEQVEFDELVGISCLVFVDSQNIARMVSSAKVEGKKLELRAPKAMDPVVENNEEELFS